MAPVTGIEPASFASTERRASITLHRRWWSWRDSNPHPTGFDSAASTNWATGPGALAGTRTRIPRRAGLSTQCVCQFRHKRWSPRRESNSGPPTYQVGTLPTELRGLELPARVELTHSAYKALSHPMDDSLEARAGVEPAAHRFANGWLSDRLPGLGPRARFELATYGLGNRRSIPLSYRGLSHATSWPPRGWRGAGLSRFSLDFSCPLRRANRRRGALDRTRTCDLPGRNRLL